MIDAFGRLAGKHTIEEEDVFASSTAITDFELVERIA